jgi:predicted outer membrane repeat protein
VRSIEVKRTTILFAAALMIAALAAGPASAQACAIPTNGEYTLTSDCTLTGTINVDTSLTIHGDGYTIDAASNQAFVVDRDESLTLDNVTVTNGNATYDGGTVTVSNSIFSDNSTGWGGAIYNVSGTVTVSNSIFSGNSADYFGGAIYSNGGTAEVSSSTFSGNSAGNFGGAIANIGGTVTVSSSTFSSNSADYDGGAVDNWGGSLTIGGCSVFQENTAGTSGDGIANYAEGTVNITGSVIYDEVYHETDPSWPALSTTAEGDWWGGADGPGALADGFTVDSWWEANQCKTESVLPKCEAVVPFGTVDLAPVSGEARFFTDFGYDLPLQPEGQLIGAIEVLAGEQTQGKVTVFGSSHVRAWLFDLEGNVVGLIPSQHENGDGVFVPYDEDYAVVGSECGYAAESLMYTGRYADMFASE